MYEPCPTYKKFKFLLLFYDIVYKDVVLKFSQKNSNFIDG